MVDGVMGVGLGTDVDPVDLVRLREAVTHGLQERDRRDVLAGVGAAVLAAPVVWWCEYGKHASVRGPLTDVCVRYPESHVGCGWVVLVPVVGAPE